MRGVSILGLFLLTWSSRVEGSEAQREKLEGEKTCSRPKVSCSEEPDAYGVKYCHLKDIKASCLKATSPGYMHYPINVDWPDDYPIVAKDGTKEADDRYEKHVKICQETCGGVDWCQGFSIHRTMDTCHLLDISSASCTLKSYARCGSRNESTLHQGWETQIAQKANGGWGAWSECVVPAGEKVGTQNRTCTNPKPALGGHPCKGISTRKCTGNGDDGGFSEWSKCSTTCGNGTQTRTCEHADLVCDGPYTRPCPNLKPCPKWGPWSNCSAPCGPGTMTRECLHGPGCEGLDAISCNVKMCPIDGGYGNWSTCHVNFTETRACDNPSPMYEGKDCQGPSSRECGFWGAWSEPSATCGNATQYRPCLVNGKEKDAGLCPGGSMNNTRACLQLDPCPHWGDWSECSTTCGNGTQVRACVGGSRGACTGPSRRTCPNNPSCPTGKYGAWKACNATCGEGWHNRDCIGGLTCEGPSAKKCQNLPKCSGWSEWSPCSATCNTHESVATKTRKCLVLGSNLHECVGPHRVQCTSLPPCPVDGGYSDWGECSRTCGFGWSIRTCSSPPPAHGGKNCTSLGPWKQKCFGGNCTADGGFGDWSTCSAPCGVGIRTRECTEPVPYLGGKPCVGAKQEICMEKSCHSAISNTTWYILPDGDIPSVVLDYALTRMRPKAKNGSNVTELPTNLLEQSSEAVYIIQTRKSRSSESRAPSFRHQKQRSILPIEASLPVYGGSVPTSKKEESGATSARLPMRVHQLHRAPNASTVARRIHDIENEEGLVDSLMAGEKVGIEPVDMEDGKKSKARFRFIQPKGGTPGRYLIQRASKCPKTHNTKKTGCHLYLGFESGMLVLTNNKTQRLHALEAGKDGVFLRLGGFTVMKKFSPNEFWTIKNKNIPVNGAWSAWGLCLQNKRTRTCTNPKPMYDGDNCEGEGEEACVCEKRSNGTSTLSNSTEGGIQFAAKKGSTEQQAVHALFLPSHS